MSGQDDKSCRGTKSQRTRSVNIRGVPEHIYVKAHNKAKRSGMWFREYAILCLQDNGWYINGTFVEHLDPFPDEVAKEDN